VKAWLRVLELNPEFDFNTRVKIREESPKNSETKK